MSTRELYEFLCRSLCAVGANNGHSHSDREICLRTQKTTSFAKVTQSFQAFFEKRGIQVDVPLESPWIYLRDKQGSIYRGYCITITTDLVLITIAE